MKASFMQLAIAIVGLVVFSSNGQAAGPDKAALMKRGQAVYSEYCKTCHQANGQGLSTVYPPLAGSDYVKTKGAKVVTDNVVNGLKGAITVNGKKFNNVMTPLPAKYTNADAAAVITFVLNSWGNNGGIVSEADVKKVRKAGK
ncbi:MAG: c-type cytochrome [Candidatus Kapaibacteriota bacterium]|jgi:nitrite reductase (NO-forming)